MRQYFTRHRTLVVFSALALLIAGVAVAGTAHRTDSSEDPLRKAISQTDCTEMGHVIGWPGELDLGVIAPGEERSETIRIINTGQESMHIVKVKPSCGCTTVKAFKDTNLKPGEEVTFEITVKAGKKDGTTSKKITFELENQPAMVLPIRIETRSETT